MKDILQFSIYIFGIKAPWFSWATAVGLVGWTGWEIFKLYKLSASRKATCKKLLGEVKELCTEFPIEGPNGVNTAAVDRLYQLISEIPFLLSSWAAFRAKLIYKTAQEDEEYDQVWLTASASSVFSEDSFLGKDFNKKNFNAIPGLVTGIGLLMTFSAILVGLLDVSIVDNKVQGLQGLIGGLSGKFVSSISALFAATFFILLEKREFHNLFGARHELLSAIDLLVPRRSDSHLLVEISQRITEQTNAASAFNPDLSKLSVGGGSSQNMEPILERMVNALDDLNRQTESSKGELANALNEMNSMLKMSEQSRPESMSGQIESLVTNLQQSLSESQKSLAESIDRMSSEFSSAQTGAVQAQSGGGADSGGIPPQVLESMNESFANTQLVLQELVLQMRRMSDNQGQGSTTQGLVVALAGLSVMIFSSVADFLGAGRFLKFGHLQDVGIMIGAIIILCGLYLNPGFRRMIPAWSTAAGGAVIMILGFFPRILGFKSEAGFGILQFTAVFVGASLLIYGLWKFFVKRRATGVQKKQFKQQVEEVPVQQ